MQFFFRKKRTDHLCVRDLEPGMVINVTPSKTAKVAAITVLNGQDGEQKLMIGGGGLPSAMAIKISFEDHPPVVAHPGEPIRSLS